MACRFRAELPAVADLVTERIQDLVRVYDGEVEAVLVVYCRSCDCVHATAVRLAAVDQRESDGAAIRALHDTMLLFVNSEAKDGIKKVESKNPNIH